MRIRDVRGKIELNCLEIESWVSSTIVVAVCVSFLSRKVSHGACLVAIWSCQNSIGSLNRKGMGHV